MQKKLGCARASLGSLSESSHVFEPQLLREIIAELGGQLQPIAADSRLAEVRQTVTLVDGTLLKALPRIAEAMWLSTRTGTVHHAWRLHTHFELDKHVPVRMDLTDGRNSGASDEKTVLRQHLERDRCYVMDRWYAQFTLFNDIQRNGSSYVCRLQATTSVFLRPCKIARCSAEALAVDVIRVTRWCGWGLEKIRRAATRPSGASDRGKRIEPHTKTRSGRKGNTKRRSQRRPLCGSPRISWTCRPRSSHCCTSIATRSNCSFASSNTCWAAGTC